MMQHLCSSANSGDQLNHSSLGLLAILAALKEDSTYISPHIEQIAAFFLDFEVFLILHTFKTEELRSRRWIKMLPFSQLFLKV